MRLTRWSRRWPRSKDNLVSLVGLVSLESLVGLVILVTICIICTLQNFQFCLAHLWTDFQSCYISSHHTNTYMTSQLPPDTSYSPRPFRAAGNIWMGSD